MTERFQWIWRPFGRCNDCFAIVIYSVISHQRRNRTFSAVTTQCANTPAAENVHFVNVYVSIKTKWKELFIFFRGFQFSRQRSTWLPFSHSFFKKNSLLNGVETEKSLRQKREREVEWEEQKRRTWNMNLIYSSLIWALSTLIVCCCSIPFHFSSFGCVVFISIFHFGIINSWWLSLKRGNKILFAQHIVALRSTQRDFFRRLPKTHCGVPHILLLVYLNTWI